MENSLSILDNKLATSGPIKGSVGAAGDIVGGRGQGKTFVLKISTCSQRLSFASTACSSPSFQSKHSAKISAREGNLTSSSVGKIDKVLNSDGLKGSVGLKPVMPPSE